MKRAIRIAVLIVGVVGTFMPGALELIRSIPDGRWGVVTSGSRLLARNRLRYCGLPVPKMLVTSDDVTHGKPDPEPYLKGAKQLGFAPADCLVIEDAPAGIESARAGGMKVIGMTSTYIAEKLAHVLAFFHAGFNVVECAMWRGEVDDGVDAAQVFGSQGFAR